MWIVPCCPFVKTHFQILIYELCLRICLLLMLTIKSEKKAPSVTQIEEKGWKRTSSKLKKKIPEYFLLNLKFISRYNSPQFKSLTFKISFRQLQKADLESQKTPFLSFIRQRYFYYLPTLRADSKA